MCKYSKAITLIFILFNSSLLFAQFKSNRIVFSFRNTGTDNAALKLNGLGNYSAPFSTLASSDNPRPDLKLFGGIGNNIVNMFKGNNLYLQLAGVGATAAIIYSNTDYHVHKYFNENPLYSDYARPVVRYAQYFPFVIGGSLYAYGKLGKDDEAVGASFAVLQASLIALVYNSLLKALTGRPNPDWRNNTDMKSLSRKFRFGFWRGGIFWGWPSGHTSSTIAVVSALTNFYPDKTWLKIVGYSYSAYMIFAVSSLGRGAMHWFSDAIAAAFIYYAVGSTVGKYYRGKINEAAGSSNNSTPPPPPQINFVIPL